MMSGARFSARDRKRRIRTPRADAGRRATRTAHIDDAQRNEREHRMSHTGQREYQELLANQNNSMGNRPVQAIGLGYTLYMRDSNGRSVRVEPGHEFHSGDRVRISLEPSVDGYLYVFHTEGAGQPEMIYPDPRLDEGENWIEAHVPMEVPSSEQSDERYHWFVFDNNPATERLYVVVTRQPLPSVPTGADLVKFCSENKDKCPWRPFSEVWAQLQDANKAEVKVVTSKTFGQSQTEKEQVATTRGLGLDQSAPQPAVIRMTATTNAPVLVTVLELIHK